MGGRDTKSLLPKTLSDKGKTNMKIGGQKVSADNIYEVFVPTGESTGIMFKCKAVRNMDEFEKRFPPPEPKKIYKPGSQSPELDLEDKAYVKAMEEYAELKHNYFYLESLSATEGLEWETVNMDEPSTWGNFWKELEDTFNNIIAQKILQGVQRANSLDPKYIEEARKRFLAGTSTQQGQDQ